MTVSLFSRSAMLSPLLALTLLALAACHATSPVIQPRPAALNSSPSTASEMRVADAALQSGNIPMAVSIYEREMTAHPNSLPALQGLADAMYLSGDNARAQQLYARAQQASNGARGPVIGLARVALREHRFDDAIALYKPLVAADPADTLAWEGLGTAWDMKGAHGKAQEVYRAALKANPTDMALSNNLGLSLILDGQPREGANVLLNIASSPNAPAQARQNLALAYGMLGNDEAAARILSMDLPKASVADNLRYYQQVRSTIASAAPVKGSPAAGAKVPADRAAPASSIVR
jgi:Flp pilus assembly protein TadD